MSSMLLRRSLDLRSLAALRILLGIYIVWDVLSRLKYPEWSLLWYTNDGFLEMGDSPHQSPIHRLWFFRGNEIFTIGMFASTISLACMFSLGYHCDAPLKLLLWLSVVSIQNKCMPVHDGSDTFCRHILLWCIQLPVASIWSIDARQNDATTNDAGKLQISTIPCWGLALQIVLMYWGTVLHRTLDRYPSVEQLVSKCTWMPPDLTAIHYCLSGTFAVRQNWATDMLRSTLQLSRVVTLVAMLIESLVPLACLLFSESFIPAVLLFQMHLGMLAVTNLPNWQFMGMLATVVWVPTHVWDRVERGFQLTSTGDTVGKRRKGNSNLSLTSMLSRGATCFLFSYMIYNWTGERGWIRKHENGDIGEFLRFSQHWVMYGIPPSSSVNTLLVVERVDGTYEDVWKTIRGEDQVGMDQVAYEHRRQQVWHNMTHLYPSPRWERAFDQWGSRKDVKRVRRLLTAMCRRNHGDWRRVELVWQHLHVMPPESPDRFQKLPIDTVVTVPCGGADMTDGGQELLDEEL